MARFGNPILFVLTFQGDNTPDNSKNEKHGDRGRANKKAGDQIKDLEDQLENATGNEAKKIK